MKTVESGATASAKSGYPMPALVAGPPSPPTRGLSFRQSPPIPAIVVMIPSGVTLRTRWLQLSAMYNEPSGPSATPLGLFIRACSAGPPSPDKLPNVSRLGPAGPLPAAVRRIPSGPTLRMR